MEVDVIDNADNGIKQRASGRCKHRLLKGGQERIMIDVHTGWVQGVYCNIVASSSLVKRIIDAVYRDQLEVFSVSALGNARSRSAPPCLVAKLTFDLRT